MTFDPGQIAHEYLEKTEVVEKGWATHLALLVFSIAASAWVLTLVFRYLGGGLAAIAVASLAGTTLFLFFLKTLLGLIWDEKHIRCDTKGLYLAQTFRSTFIDWDNVISARNIETRKKGLPGRIALTTPGGEYVLSSVVYGHPELEACIYYHLAKRQKADSLKISDSAKSLWFDIPVSLDSSREWKLEIDRWGDLKWVQASQEKLTAKTSKTLTTIKWKNVETAQWMGDASVDFEGALQIIASGDKRKKVVEIPVESSVRECRELLFLTIKHLRNQGFPVYIPSLLRDALEIKNKATKKGGDKN